MTDPSGANFDKAAGSVFPVEKTEWIDEETRAIAFVDLGGYMAVDISISALECKEAIHRGQPNSDISFLLGELREDRCFQELVDMIRAILAFGAHVCGEKSDEKDRRIIEKVDAKCVRGAASERIRASRKVIFQNKVFVGDRRTCVGK